MHGGGGGGAPTKKGELKKTKVEIIPMIDTMFFLLVFFILSSVGALKLQGINIQVPQQRAAATTNNDTDKEKPLEITITIDPDGLMQVNAKPVTPDKPVAEIIRQEGLKIKNLADGDPADTVKLYAELRRAVVVVSADPQAEHEFVIKAIDEARKLRGELIKDGTLLSTKEVEEGKAVGEDEAALEANKDAVKAGTSGLTASVYTHRQDGYILIDQFAIANKFE